MRPGRDDIAVPPFPPGTTWIGAEDRSIGLEWDAIDRSLSEGSAAPRVFADLKDAGHVTFSLTCW